ncbi:hypothetical protein [Coleofasciculus chthonoplastes]|uniref:hypothetical protein n=1 Tax=Coleofasciculus chthonoplastes TaxID=64178 RepID=UPI0033017200
MLELNLSPIYYRTGLNSPVPFPGLPANASAYAHQLQTYCAVTRTRNYAQVSTWCQTCELAQTCPVAQLAPLPQHGTLCITNSAVTGGGILGFRDGGGVVEANIYRAIGGKRDNGKSLDEDFSPVLNLEIPYFDYPKSQQAQTFPFHRYSLTYLLRRTNCRFITQDKFSHYLQQYEDYPEAQTYSKQLAQANPMIYGIVFGDLPQPRRWHFYSNSGQYRWVKGGMKQKRDYPILDKVRRISGLSVELEKTEAALDIESLNQALEKRDAIAYIGKGNGFRYAIETHLPPLFELCPFRWGAPEAQYYLAFDLNAFFSQ